MCARPSQLPRQPPAEPRSRHAGRRGHLALEGTDGFVTKLDQEPVYAVPATDYSRFSWMKYLTNGIKTFSIPIRKDGRADVMHFDDATFAVTHKTVTNSEGRFEFTDLPTDKFYIVALPGVNVIGSGPLTSKFVRIVPSVRAGVQCRHQGEPTDCKDTWDFDQFFGARSEF